MYDGYAFEVIVETKRPLSQRPQLSRRSARGGPGRLLASVLRAHVGSHAVDRSRSPGDRSLQHCQRLLGRADQAHTKNCPKAKPIWRRKLPAARWAFIGQPQRRQLHPLASACPQQLLLQSLRHPRTLPRLPHRRRARHRRLARHRDGRDRSLVVLAGSVFGAIPLRNLSPISIGI